ncbi:hypothetical protein DFH07DRAFT_795593 [Mycena maculata]|uniref:Uncharacterized protein n=1 Tax=Mycena maculata TaxID=230809 RepID=A0AAD7NX72_9AGAR|nr:hypothetical protein DFH07DRAFT_795593 [Mycena maculata]
MTSRTRLAQIVLCLILFFVQLRQISGSLTVSNGQSSALAPAQTSLVNIPVTKLYYPQIRLGLFRLLIPKETHGKCTEWLCL